MSFIYVMTCEGEILKSLTMIRATRLSLQTYYFFTPDNYQTTKTYIFVNQYVITVNMGKAPHTHALRLPHANLLASHTIWDICHHIINIQDFGFHLIFHVNFFNQLWLSYGSTHKIKRTFVIWF